MNPRSSPGPSLVLDPSARVGGPYTLEAGTLLRLVEEYDAEAEEWSRELDMSLFFQFAGGWRTRTYEIVDGPNAGRRLVFSAAARSGRFPPSTDLAHAALEPLQAHSPAGS